MLLPYNLLNLNIMKRIDYCYYYSGEELVASVVSKVDISITFTQDVEVLQFNRPLCEVERIRAIRSNSKGIDLLFPFWELRTRARKANKALKLPLWKENIRREHAKRMAWLSQNKPNL